MQTPAIERPELPPVPDVELPFVASPGAPGRFSNPWEGYESRGAWDVLKWKLGQSNPWAGDKRSRPPEIPVASDPQGRWGSLSEGARLQWLGHASVLVELDGVVALIDPVFGKVPPGIKRHAPAPRLPQALPRVDVVLISHGHYDHLDRRSIRSVLALWPQALVATPLGLARSLPRVARAARVVELSWWERFEVRGVTFTLVPAQHWHRRGVSDTNKALWGGWFLRGSRSVYHSGDTGYFGGFRTIGRVMGPPDVAVLPLGAYEPRWFMGVQHMSPEDSLRAWEDLGAGHFVGMHWGTFDLTDEPLDHGAFELMPMVARARGLPLERLHVLGHGGALGFSDPRDAVPSGRAPISR